jgi:cellobiose transport system permease protein
MTDKPSIAPASRRRRPVDRPRWPVYAVLVLVVGASIYPLYWMFVVSTTDAARAVEMPPNLIPGGNFSGLAAVAGSVLFLRSLLNSLIIAGAIGVSQAFLCALAGFAFAKLKFPGRNALFVVVVLTMTVPSQLAVVPQYMLVSWLGWVDTLQAVIVPGLASAFGIFWMRQHIASAISDELLQAARVDGASTWNIFWRIVFPLVRPAAVVLGLYGFLYAWNDFLWPFIVLKSPEHYTVQIAIKALGGLAMPASFLATLPMLILFAFVGRRLLAGIMNGSLKQ